MDQETTVIVFGAAAVAVNKILGPTADYLGTGMQAFAQHRIENLRCIFANAEAKLGDRIDEPGAVPPRVLGRIVDEGSYSSDAIATEYLGGILASSRSGISRDDRGVGMISTVSRLSTYQLRTHYICYSTLHVLYAGRNLDFGVHPQRRELRTFIPESEFLEALDLSDDEPPDALVSHILAGLVREQLIDDDLTYGSEKVVDLAGVHGKGRGFVFVPSVGGAELFLWAHGLPHLGPGHLFTADLPSARDLPIPLPRNALSTFALPRDGPTSEGRPD